MPMSWSAWPRRENSSHRAVLCRVPQVSEEDVLACLDRVAKPQCPAQASTAHAASIADPPARSEEARGRRRPAGRLPELRCENDLAVVPGATHLFEEPGILDAAAGLARDWFISHLTMAPPGERGTTAGSASTPSRRRPDGPDRRVRWLRSAMAGKHDLAVLRVGVSAAVPESVAADDMTEPVSLATRFTLLGIGAMNSPRYAPAGLLIEHGQVRVAIDGGPGAEPDGPVTVWLVTDERAELIRQLRRLAAAHGLSPAVSAYRDSGLTITPQRRPSRAPPPRGAGGPADRSHTGRDQALQFRAVELRRAFARR